MSLSDRIRQVLSVSGSMDDDELAQRLGVVRQQINATARRMERRGLLTRHAGRAGKIVNELVDEDVQVLVKSPVSSAEGGSEPAGGQPGAADVLLVTCVKTKASTPCAAKDLYLSPLFRKERAYAERLGVPWFILSAEHGLVAPDEWLAPYERYLPDTSSTYREAWGRWVVERLKLLLGDLGGRTVEVHASEVYVAAIGEHLRSARATVLEPLRGLAQGARLRWYDAQSNADVPSGRGERVSAADLVAALTSTSGITALPDLIERGSEGLRVPGLYSWWVDGPGAEELAAGLGQAVAPGLIYAGLAGATRWPSGTASANTLWSRITAMHLGRRHTASTLRLSLGSVLAAARGWPQIEESELTSWMLEHLSVVLVPYVDADTLGGMEGSVLAELDPPLNLQGRPATPVRVRLSELRRRYSAKK